MLTFSPSLTMRTLSIEISAFFFSVVLDLDRVALRELYIEIPPCSTMGKHYVAPLLINDMRGFGNLKYSFFAIFITFH